MKVEKNARVRLKIKLTVEDGDVIEQNVVEYFQGAGTMLPALEGVVDGLKAGDKRDGVLPANQAFGNPALEQHKAIARTEFPKDAKFEVGMKFMAKGADNRQDVVLRVTEIDDDAIQVAMCHPLHDKNIQYELEVLHVSNATPPPLPADAILEAVD